MVGAQLAHRISAGCDDVEQVPGSVGRRRAARGSGGSGAGRSRTGALDPLDAVLDRLGRPLASDPAGRPGRHLRPWCCDPIVDVGPRAVRACRLVAPPSMLAPHQPSRPAEARQIRQHHRWPSFTHARVSQPVQPHPNRAGLDVNHARGVGLVNNGEQVHLGQPDKAIAHARGVGLFRGSRTWSA